MLIYKVKELAVLMLLNRCVLNWFGDWSTGAFYQVGQEFTQKLDVEKPDVSVHTHTHITYTHITYTHIVHIRRIIYTRSTHNCIHIHTCAWAHTLLIIKCICHITVYCSKPPSQSLP